MTPRADRIVPYWGALREIGAGTLLRRALARGPAAAGRLIRDADLLLRSGLYDAGWYLARHPDAAPQGLLHYLDIGWRKGADPGPGFDARFYLERYPDVARAGVDPARHFVRHGRRERRRPLPPPGAVAAAPAPEPEPEPDRVPEQPDEAPAAGIEPGPAVAAPDAEAPAPPAEAPDPFAPERLAAALAAFEADFGAAEAAVGARADLWPVNVPDGGVEVLVHARGNLFMAEIAELIAAGFAAAGFEARLGDETAGAADGRLRVIVAPHEFFVLGGAAPLDLAEEAVLVNVEQLHTDWFRAGLPALRRARGVLDISPQSAAALAEAGLPVAFLPLGHVPGFAGRDPAARLPDAPALATVEASVRDACPDVAAPLVARPLDLFFVGFLSQRRSDIFGRMAPRLARWRCHLALTDGTVPLVRGANGTLGTEATLGLTRRAKIVLNLHQSERAYFEWHRIVLQGLWQGSLVVTEPSPPVPWFAAGEHFLEAPLDEIPDLIDWLLGTEAGRRVAERVRLGGHRRLVEDVRLDRSLAGLFAPGRSHAGRTP